MSNLDPRSPEMDRLQRVAEAEAVRQYHDDLLAAKGERDRLLVLVETLRDHIEGFHGECHCVRKIDAALSATEPAE